MLSIFENIVIRANILRTAQNSRGSPLLRLPPELRNAIWRLAFGEKMIYVHAHRIPRSDAYSMTYNAVDSVSKEPLKSLCFLPDPTVINPPIVPQLVSRQYWAEASEVFLDSCTFRIDLPRVFRELALSRQAVVPRIRRLMINSKDNLIFTEDWRKVLTNSYWVGKYVSLEGLQLEVDTYWAFGTLVTVDIMNDNIWKITNIPAMIRSFQQHKLKESLTTVAFKPYKFRWTYVDLTLLDPVIRMELLQHRPRRVSKRVRQGAV